MKFPQVFRFTLILALVSMTLVTVVTGQKRSRDELLKEAGRLVINSERRMGEAIKKVRAGGDPKLEPEAKRFMAESFEKAIELWRQTGHDERLIDGVEALSRFNSGFGEYAKVVALHTREAEYWRDRGNVAAQTKTLYSLGLRQSQMKREAAAIETFERVLLMSRSAQLRSLERDVLTQMASSYERVGRLKDAESARETANRLWAAFPREPVRTMSAKPVPPGTIPPQWVDLPDAPAASDYRVVEGVSEAVLANRSDKGIKLLMFGCVALEDDKKVRFLYSLIGVAQPHRGVLPGPYYKVFSGLNGPLSHWRDEKMG